VNLAVADLLEVKLTLGVGGLGGVREHDLLPRAVMDQKEDVSLAGQEVLPLLGLGGGAVRPGIRVVGDSTVSLVVSELLEIKLSLGVDRVAVGAEAQYLLPGASIHIYFLCFLFLKLINTFGVYFYLFV
jgi:hypothetical protein